MRLIITVIFLLLSFTALAKSQNRFVVVIYDGSQYELVRQSHGYQHLQLFLNHLGFKVLHRDVRDLNAPWPKAESEPYAIVSWFRAPLKTKTANAFCTWLLPKQKSGMRWVSLDNPGFFGSEGQLLAKSCLQNVEHLGAEYLGQYTSDPMYFDFGKRDSNMVEFERALRHGEDNNYVLIKKRSADVKTYLQISRRDLANSESDVVFTSPRGGYAHLGYVMHVQLVGEDYHTAWRLNVLRFLEEALDVATTLKPDITTRFGKRMFMTHVDGDGIFNVTQFDASKYAGEVFDEQILKKYSDWPIGLSLITGYFDLPQFHQTRHKNLYRKLFTPKNIETAAHGHAHPLIWKQGTLALKIPNYSFDPNMEITGAVQKIKNLFDELKLGDVSPLYYWTGDCRPTDAQLEIAESAGLINYNGGTGRFDERHSSLAFINPSSYWNGTLLQVLAAFPNENVYTNLWESRYWGFRDVISGFEHSETPERLKPIDVYYHYYSAEKLASLESLKKIYKWVETQDVFPVHVSTYANSVRDFYKLEIQDFESHFVIKNYGELRTLRLPKSRGVPDIKNSNGILGYRAWNDFYYVHLDSGIEARLNIKKSDDSKTPYIESANVEIKNWRIQDSGAIQFEFKGWRTYEFVLAGFLPNKNHKIIHKSQTLIVASDDSGRLKFQIPKKGFDPTWQQVEVGQ